MLKNMLKRNLTAIAALVVAAVGAGAAGHASAQAEGVGTDVSSQSEADPARQNICGHVRWDSARDAAVLTERTYAEGGVETVREFVLSPVSESVFERFAFLRGLGFGVDACVSGVVSPDQKGADTVFEVDDFRLQPQRTAVSVGSK